MAEIKIKLDSNIDELVDKIIQLQNLIEEINNFDLNINVLNDANEIVSSTKQKDRIVNIKTTLDFSELHGILSSL